MTPEQRLHVENITRLAGEGVRDAYRYLIGYAACLEGYECFPRKVGSQPDAKRDFRYMRGTSQPYAFIINDGHLLFYIRRPGRDETRLPVARLREAFPDSDVQENNSGEIRFKICSLDEAIRAMALIFS